MEKDYAVPDDQMMFIYNKLKESSLIIEKVTAKRIKFYEYPEAGDFTGTYIVIDPITFPLPSAYGDNKTVSHTHIYQVDVWTNQGRSVKDAVTKEVMNVLECIGYYPFAGGADQYDEKTRIYRTAIRYRKTIENTEIRKGEF